MTRITAESFKPYDPNKSVRPTKKFHLFNRHNISRLTQDDVEKVKELYKTHSVQELAKALGVGRTTLHNFMRNYGIERRTASQTKLVKKSKK